MADVFLSYKRDERAAVETIASRLRELGLTVWFDASMSAGEAFNAEIDREARAAKAMLVCWSPAARQSEWVNAEAMIGFEQKKLAACYVAGPDGFSAPTPFNASHVEDLRAWLATPSETHTGWRSVLRRIGKLCGRSDIESWGALAANAHEASSPLTAVHTRLRARDQEVSERRPEHEPRERPASQATQEAEAARIEHETYTAQSRGSAEGLFWAGAIVVVTFVIGAVFLASSAPPETQSYNTFEESIEAGETAPVSSSEPPQAQTFRVGQEFDDCSGAGWCPRMVVIPSGGIMMGDDTYISSQPSHLITISRIAVGKFEVTFAEWDACVDGGGCNRFSPADEGWGRGRRPVMNVSWDDAQQYVRWLSQATEQGYRLLSEAEWEFAARGFVAHTYHTGGSFSAAQGNVLSSVGRTQPVGTYEPNPFGLHDIHGNVKEWVQDCWNDNYRSAPVDGSAWMTGECTYHVVRGDSWLGFSSGGFQAAGSADRDRAIHTAATTTLGFRVARSIN